MISFILVATAIAIFIIRLENVNPLWTIGYKIEYRRNNSIALAVSVGIGLILLFIELQMYTIM